MINVTTNLLKKVASIGIKCQFIKASIINVTTNLLKKVATRDLKCQFMKASVYCMSKARQYNNWKLFNKHKNGLF